MPIILGILLLIALGGPAVVLAKRMNRPVRAGGHSRGSPARPAGRTKATTSTRSTSGKTTGPGRASTRSARGYQRTGGGPSWVLKAWNASGAPKTSETTLKGASAVVTGKAAGAVSRGGWRVSKHLGRGGVWFGNKALKPFDRWLERKRAGLEAAAGQASTRPAPAGEPTPAPVPELVNDSGLPWREKYRLEQAYQRYAELRRRSGSPLTPAQIANEVDIDRDAAEKVAAHWDYRFQRENPDATRSEPEPAASPPPVRTNPFRSNKGDTPVDNAVPAVDRTAVPAALVAHLDAIADFHPEDDAELLNFLKGEVTGMLAYAEAIGQMFENCVEGKGLDPAAMQGVSDYAEATAENAAAAANGHKQFVAVYDAIIEAAANGVRMPYNGRFFSGESAA